MRLRNLIRCTVLSALALVSVQAQETPEVAPVPAKYPLRVHIIAIDDTHKTVRMQPNWCAGTVPDMGGGTGGGGGESSPCGGSSTAGLGGGDDDFSGTGRGDLVNTPDANTQGFTFTYEGCPRVRVPAGFQGLPARWSKAGRKLEVMIPSDAMTGADRPMPTQKCTLTVKTQEFVYLRLRSGKIVQVSQEAFLRKPSLRALMSGGPQTLERRAPPVVSVKGLMQAGSATP